ncbi:outer membrane lipoprotein chaperone LolA [Ideonella azotifigens]|uniref:Outer-membrane lipoprotein carrier protein n=1 Tax=Ideonella azotifigens TaxID=513160 RepID=A0ABN1KHH6_9BURK|nr:outer membrane lipoprotein chaperone LolA [Ideonella azotifigens]MCD2343637.1 outer membrane lipoprotein chaperone LolA [Ideonella azotifigens]
MKLHPPSLAWPRRQFLSSLLAAAAAGVAGSAHAQATDATEALRAFVRDAKAGRASFTQTVKSPDGKKTKNSSGKFEFSRPNRFRFVYEKPYAQTIVSDGQKVWFHDPDLNQVTVRKLGDALGSTPAALLAGQTMDKDFELKNQPDADGLAWVLATPRQKDGAIQSLRIGFKGKQLAALEIADSFGQRSMLQFNDLQIEASLPPETFRFTVPAGADVAEQ